MTRTTLLFALLLPSVLLACDEEAVDSGTTPDTTTGSATTGTTGTAQHGAACAGTQLGTYTGDDAGVVSGELEADGTLTITFGSTFGDVHAEAEVTPAGAVSGSQGGVTISGTYDLTGCSGSGDWVNTTLGYSGTWQIERS